MYILLLWFDIGSLIHSVRAFVVKLNAGTAWVSSVAAAFSSTTPVASLS